MCHFPLILTIKRLLTLCLLLSFSSFAANPDNHQFDGWGKAGSNTDEYKTGFIEKTHPDQPQVGFIRSLNPSKNNFGTIMRTAGISKHKGKRIQLTTKLKTQKAYSAGAWFRVNGKYKTLSFDNMSKRRLQGTQDWQEVTLVLDIPKQAVSVSYGVLLEGKGKVWFHEPKFQIVDLTVQTTERNQNELRQLQVESDSKQANNDSGVNTLVTKKR